MPRSQDRLSTLFLLTCAAMAAGFGLWTLFGTLDVASVAEGEVVPSTRVKRVQHLEGGIIQDILAREGDHVAAGQELLVLESVASESSVAELAEGMASLRSEITALEAVEKGSGSPNFPEELRREHPAKVEQAAKLFSAHRERLQSAAEGQRHVVVQRSQAIAEIQARLKNSNDALAILNERIALSEKMLGDRLTTRSEHLALLQQKAQLTSRIEEDTAGLQQARAALASEKAALDRLLNGDQETTRQRLAELRRELEVTQQRLRKQTDSQDRTVIRSPVAGVVKTLYVVNKGEVVRPGVTILDVVPDSDRLVVEARLPVAEIGFVRPGQRAVVRLASRDASRFGGLDGEVRQVSPDTLTVSTGQTFYRVRIETERTSFENNGARYDLYPGMLVTAAIVTGKRSIIEYLLTPFLSSLGPAMQER